MAEIRKLFDLPLFFDQYKVPRRKLPGEIYWLATDGHCWYCGGIPEQRNRTVDHILALNRRYTCELRDFVNNHHHNRAPSCRSCNSAKGQKTIKKFKEMLERDIWNWPFYSSPITFWFETQKLTFPVIREENMPTLRRLYRANHPR